MSGLQRLVVAIVVLAVGGIVFSAIGWGPRPIERIESPSESPKESSKPRHSHPEPFDAPFEEPDWLRDPIRLAHVPADIREIERSRRPQRPASDPKPRWFGGSPYDLIVAGRKEMRPRSAEAMPPTLCRSVEPVPEHGDYFSGPRRVHDVTMGIFENASGFGMVRMLAYRNRRGIELPPWVDRVELVSLLTDYEVSVYVLDEMASPALARQAKRRPLDEFEQLALDAVRRGEDLMWTPEAPKRMFGAIRAEWYCLECHTSAKKGDLLGAFAYYLDTTADRLTEGRPK